MQRALARLTCFSLLLGSTSAAGEPPARANPAASAADPALKSEARSQFEQGVALFEQGAFDRALALFRRSLETYPTRAAATNIVLCLKKLGRFDEALDVLQSIPERFAPLSTDDRSEYDAEVAELSKQVGQLELRGVEAGSQVEIDAVLRATAPLVAPIRVSRGEHRLRVTLTGKAALEQRVYVAGGQTVTLDVHQTALQDSARDANGENTLVIAPSEPRERELAGADTGPAARQPRERACQPCVGAEAGVAMVPSWGGNVAGSSAGWGTRILGRAAYGLGRSWSLSLDAGYLGAATSVSDRDTQVLPTGLVNPGTASDELGLRGALAGASIAFRPRTKLEPRFRLGIGALWASLTDERSGSFQGRISSSMARPPVYAVRQTEHRTAEYAYASLSGEVGLRIAGHARAGLGVDVAGFFAIRQPTWDDRQNFLGPNGDSSFAGDALSGKFVAMITPFASVEYEF